MQDHAAENDADQSEPAQGGAGILRSGLGAPHEDQQKQESQMNANFDSEKTSDRDGPTAHRHAYQYSIYLDTDSRCGVAKRRIGRARSKGHLRYEREDMRVIA